MVGRNPRADTDPSRKDARSLLLDRRLLAYAAAAGAAMAGAQTAQAEVQSRTLDVTVFAAPGAGVYSESNIKLDVDQDGTDDFEFYHFSFSSGAENIAFVEALDDDTGRLAGATNSYIGGAGYDVKLVDATVETASNSVPNADNKGEDAWLAATPGGSWASYYNSGNWAGQSGFLALSFESSTTGNIHAGFVQLSVDANDSATPLAIRLTGVAWEDQAYTDIHVKNIAKVVPEPVSLGLLAMGAVGIAAMRRRQSP